MTICQSLNEDFPRRVSTIFIAAVLSAVVAVPATARPDSRQLSCAAATDLVRKSGSVIITTGPHLYGEVFATSSACRARTAQVKRAQTRDNPRCPIGYTCRPYSGGDR